MKFSDNWLIAAAASLIYVTHLKSLDVGIIFYTPCYISWDYSNKKN